MAKFIELSCAPGGVKSIFNADLITNVSQSALNGGVMCTLVSFNFSVTGMYGDSSQAFNYVLESYEEIKAMLEMINNESKLA